MNERMRRLIPLVIVCLILSLGFALRRYNLNFPSIGYHNMEENGYLGMAQEMSPSGDFATGRGYFYNGFDEKPAIQSYRQPPLFTYQILASWKIFGDNIWGVRLLNVLFGVFSILVIYYISLLLFNNVTVSLWCAFLLSIMPLGVFFSRNIQPESPAFFFMLLGNLFYLKFALSLKKYNLLLGGFSFSVALLYRFGFIIGALAPLCCFPVKSLFKNKKDSLKFLLTLCIPFLIVAFVLVWIKRPGLWMWDLSVLERMRILQILTYDYWSKYAGAIWWYINGENFTLLYTLLSLLGIAIAFFKRGGLLERYIMGWAIALIPYGMIFSDFINQHNYSQFPFLALVCVSVAYGIRHVLKITTFKNAFWEYSFLFLVIIITAVSAPFVYNSISRMYGTFFLGLDVAGESLREFTNRDERVFLLTHAQGQGISRYARRYTGWTEDLDDFKDKEKRFTIRYICFYPAEFGPALKAKNPPLFDYIQNNYHVKEVGLTEEPSQLYYIVLEKGEGSGPQTFLQSFSGAKQLRAIYRIFDRYIFFYTLRPQSS